MSMSYDCHLCLVDGTGGAGGGASAGGATAPGGAANTGGSAATGGATAPGGASGGGSSSKGCACSLTESSAEGWLGRIFLLVGMFGFLHARRRRRLP